MRQISGPDRLRPMLAVMLLVAGGTAAAEAAAPKTTLSIGLALEPPTLDPSANPAESIRSITNGNVFEGLTAIDQDGHVQPLLAHDWTVSPDGLRYDFHLQPGVKFQDGTAFDCPVVQFSYGRAAAKDSINPQKQFFEPIAKVECPSPVEAVVTLTRPVGSFLYDMAWPDAAMIAPGSAAGNATHPIGTGPYRFSSWRRGDSLTLERNDAYWGPKPAIRTVVFRFITDPLAATNALEGGQLDAYPSFPSQELLARFRGDPRFAVEKGTFPIKILMALNEAVHPFDDIRVRQALAYAIDRHAMLQAIGDGDGTVIGSHMSPSDPDYVDLSGRYPFDPAKAKQLLAAAGVKPGTPIAITIPPVDYARKSGELVAAFLGEVGLNVTLVPVEWPQWLSQVFAHAAYQTTIVAHTEPHDLDIYARPSYYFGYHDAAYRTLFQRYESTNDPAARHALSVQLQQKLADDEPNVFLFSTPRYGVWDAKLHGMWHNQPIAAIPVAGVTWSP
ncbi:ABC transporter substrate-binding protein [Lichenicola sp.]|uniref:ABC transporter substrate-binding protein n=1 Tax=Lichenicola sp. TaxID=2804529 RepID=UPI003B00D0EA